MSDGVIDHVDSANISILLLRREKKLIYEEAVSCLGIDSVEKLNCAVCDCDLLRTETKIVTRTKQRPGSGVANYLRSGIFPVLYGAYVISRKAFPCFPECFILRKGSRRTWMALLQRRFKFVSDVILLLRSLRKIHRSLGRGFEIGNLPLHLAEASDVEKID